MSDDNASDKKIADGSRALECFTDRIEAVRRFNQYINEEPPPRTFLFFHGLGGNGKSLLLSFLRKHCCRLLSGWESLDDVGHASLKRAYPDQRMKPLPSAFVDFGMPPNGGDNPKDGFSALLMLRRDLSGDNLRFPLYDFACIWHLYRTKRLSPEYLASMFPAEELGLIGAISDVVSKGAVGALATAVINLFGKHYKDRAAVYWRQRDLDETDVRRIQNLNNPSDLLNELPACFAADLNASMQLADAPWRVVLFFDTHEAFWSQHREAGDDPSYYRQDEWFRRLLHTLEPERGIVVVAAGQEVPRWSKARKHPIPDTKVEYRLIGNLSREDAHKYLRQLDIEDAPTRELVCTCAEVQPEEVHPLFLGLCADILLEALERNIKLAPDEFQNSLAVADIGATLMERLLNCVDERTRDAVCAVSACRAFNQELYFALAAALHFDGVAQAFRRLTRFSFVSRVDGRGPDAYKIHDLLRRLIRESNAELEYQANVFLEKYYRELSGPTAKTEAIYHASRLDCKRAVREWVEVFDSAAWSSDYSLCRALLAVRGDLGARGHLELGMLARCEGDFCRIGALYAESAQEYKKALKHFDQAELEGDGPELQRAKVVLLHNLGELQSELSRNGPAGKSYRKVIDICGRLLDVAKDDAELYDFKAAAFLGLANIDIWSSRSEPAIVHYSDAIKVCDQALQHLTELPLSEKLNSALVDILNDKAYGFGGIGDVQSSLYRHKEAIQNYQEAESCYDEALRRAADVVVQNDKAYNCVSIAESEIALSQYEPALENCNRALLLYDEILQRAREDLIYHSNKSRALRIAGVALTGLARHDEAVHRYDEALAACSGALERSPTDIWALCNKGLVLLSRGEMHAERGEYEDALESLKQALDAFESFLQQSPEDAEALAGKGRVLFRKGEVLSGMHQPGNAVTEYIQSLASFDLALEDASEDAEARKDKGNTLRRLGETYLLQGRRVDALEVLDRALAEYSHSLKISPEFEPAREGRDQLAASLSKLRAEAL